MQRGMWLSFQNNLRKVMGVCKWTAARLESKGPQIAVIGTLSSHPLTIDLVYLHQHQHWPHPCCCNMRPTKPSLQSSLTMSSNALLTISSVFQHCEWQSSVLSALWITTQGRQETANREGPCVRIGATRNRPPQIYFLYSVDSWANFCIIFVYLAKQQNRSKCFE